MGCVITLAQIMTLEEYVILNKDSMIESPFPYAQPLYFVKQFFYRTMY